MDRLRTILLIAVLLLPAAGPACADEDPNRPQTAQNATDPQQNAEDKPFSFFLDDDSTATSGELVQQFFLAVLFVAALGTAAWFLSRRVMPKFALTRGRHIKVVETVSLGPRKQVHLLAIGAGRRILVGSTSDHVAFLADITDSLDEPEPTPSEGKQADR